MKMFVAEPGLPIQNTETQTIDSDTLRKDLEQHIEGEVRFDRVSRALYSTDASVYQIEPLGAGRASEAVTPRTARSHWSARVVERVHVHFLGV